MADYWKSNPRKFCEFCKCWTIDNKASRDFHERGKRHQENVRLKISELKRKGVEDAKKEKETSQLMKDIEKAALLQFRKDMLLNPNLASQYGIDLNNKAISFEDKSKVQDCSTRGDEVVDSEDNGGWEEVVMEDGQVYYWNKITNESAWELPIGANQEPQKDTVSKRQTNKRKQSDNIKTEIKSDDIKTEIKSEPFDCKPDLKDICNTKREIYNWQSVDIKPQIKDDSIMEGFNYLELPVDTLNHAIKYPADVYQIDEVEKLEFKEKIVPTKCSNSSTSVAFKKRKINRNNRTNNEE